ncbi:hypothetical protein EV190_11441 [Actinorugispora endophytica]|uniref:CopC domain-containing protein n=1 Tax=Actinorugispora endophytica TaxID=1605990 RepID=A0A4V3D827_9ACTN|nr:hypothetical protein EV190_11441 [Actinorugispora endophytica]
MWCAALGGVVLAGSPAAAHDQLIASTPEDGERLDSAPEDITLTFSGDVLDLGAAVTVLDSGSTPVAEGEARVDGPDVVQGLPPDLPDGAYTVRWRVVSGDGHPISGTFDFIAGDVPEETDGPPPATADGGTAPPPPSPAADAAASSQTSFPVRTVVLALLGAATGLSVYCVAVFAARRRSRRAPHHQDQ